MFQRLIYFVRYLFFFVIMALLAVFYRQPFFVFACLLLLFLPFASYYICRYVMSQLTLLVSAKTTESLRNTPIPLMIQIKNSGIFPLLEFTVTMHIESPFYQNPDRERITVPVLARSDNRQTFPITFGKLGCYQISVESYEAWDSLHLFRFHYDSDAHTQITIFPQNQEKIEISPSCYSEGFDEFDETRGRGQVTGDVTNIREYIPGDRMQQIHWKLSGKLEKWMVKEYGATASHCFILLVELYAPDETDRSHVLDRTLEHAYGGCMELLQIGEPFFLCTYSILKEDFISFQIQNQEMVRSAFSQICYETPYREADLAYERFQASGFLKGTVLHVTQEGINVR
ncbi:MAG: DUF58 domain-containing protein [Roseburia sp.]